MKTVDIKGKPYVEVNERIKFFRENYQGWALISELVSDIDGKAIIKASILDPEQVVKATGYAYEQEGNSFINKTSYIENCETSAWGRALGNFGIGIDTAVASSDEVQNAINNQNSPVVLNLKDASAKLQDRFNALLDGLPMASVLEWEAKWKTAASDDERVQTGKDLAAFKKGLS